MGFRTQASKWVVVEEICAPGCGMQVSSQVGVSLGLGKHAPSQMVVELDCKLGCWGQPGPQISGNRNPS